jgi:hypothetical protein
MLHVLQDAEIIKRRDLVSENIQVATEGNTCRLLPGYIRAKFNLGKITNPSVYLFMLCTENKKMRHRPRNLGLGNISLN